jgi:glycine dehydrogenase
VSFDEVSTMGHAQEVVDVLAKVLGGSATVAASEAAAIPAALQRTTPALSHPIFSKFTSETDMLRYIYHLQNKDLGLQHAMMPLGSCTMKLNSTTEMIPVTWSEFGGLHPYAPEDQALGYKYLFEDLGKDLANLTGFHTVSLQPNSGAQGEYAGLMAIASYHRANAKDGASKRDVCLIPMSAHGTNPASAVMAGMRVVPVQCDDDGNVDVADLYAKAEKHADNLAALMITYPSTHGVFETTVKDICAKMHEHGGMVYMDGANLNAQCGLCSPGEIGADVCHLNLHKTFCIPHGGGGPGMGPIGVVEALAPHLPDHPMSTVYDAASVGNTVAAAPYSSASILPISYAYIKMMGSEGLTYATKIAILSANYLKQLLKDDYKVLFTAENGTVAHEFILDLRPFKNAVGVSETDVAKRLIDYSFHAPTMSWPVAGTLMVEPTESEPKAELDRFADAMKAIRSEIQEVMDGKQAKTSNCLTHAPHTIHDVAAPVWDRGYSRDKGCFPVESLRKDKFWPSVGRVDDVYGDRNPVCSCPSMDEYQ